MKMLLYTSRLVKYRLRGVQHALVLSRSCDMLILVLILKIHLPVVS